MIKESLRSIKTDISRSIFYWLTFVLTSMFIFLIFNISYSDVVGVTFINSKNNLSTFITVIVIAICMTVIFFSNDFYVKKKSKDIAIRLVCGATYIQIASYLLIQTTILLVLALPLGVILAINSLPLINIFLSNYLSTSINIFINNDAFYSTTLILIIVIIWCIILNLGYAYRSSINSLLQDNQGLKVQVSLPVLYNIKIKQKTVKIASILIYLLPIVGIYYYGNDNRNMLFMSVIGMIGFNMFLNNILLPRLDYINKTTTNSNKLIYIGFIRNDIKELKFNIILMIFSCILFISLMVISLGNTIEMVLSLLSFVIINILLVLAIMFKLSTNLATRSNLYTILSKIGYQRKDLNIIRIKEIILFYTFLAFSVLLYMINIFISLYLHHILKLDICIIMTIIFIIPVIICAIINIYYYKKAS